MLSVNGWCRNQLAYESSPILFLTGPHKEQRIANTTSDWRSTTQHRIYSKRCGHELVKVYQHGQPLSRMALRGSRHVATKL